MSKKFYKQISRLHKIISLFVIVSVSVIAFAKINSSDEAFSQAKDFPEGALVYAQFQDLPALKKLWDESELKLKYLQSTNFTEFENKHLALKLLSRLEEFQAASGFPFDISSVVYSSETKAAIAVYNIGRLEFVFVAPLSEEKFAASQFFVNKSAFEENKLEDGTVFYGRNILSDRGRQRQKLLFANVRGRFVLGTDEVKFIKTLAIISKTSKEKSLFDQTGFKYLSEKTTPHSATIWVDQRKLNDDWYFKHYWAFKNLENLKKINGGIFDFEMQKNKFIEHRKFLLNGKTENKFSNLSARDVEKLQKMIPENIPYYKFQTIDSNEFNPSNEIQKTLLDGFLTLAERKNSNDHQTSYNRYYYDEYSDYSEKNYNYLSGKYDAEINRDEEDFADVEENSSENIKINNELQKAIEAANPQTAVSFISPQTMPMPLFFENRRALILTLQNENKLDQNKLETLISELAQNQLTISKKDAVLEWKNGENWRELQMPMLGWKLAYSVQNGKIIFSNSAELLSSIFSKSSVENKEQKRPNIDFNELTIIRFGQHKPEYDSLLGKIREIETKDEENQSVDFFADNIGSLFDVLSNVNRVEIKKSCSSNYLSEDIEFFLREF